MKTTTGDFRKTARQAIDDKRLQAALESATEHFRAGRQGAFAEFPNIEILRDHLKQARAATLANLGTHLEAFERNAVANGSTVHWAEDSGAAANIVLDIARRRGASSVVKSKSMITEEIHLNQHLEHNGLEVTETDLGEWIVQLAEEAPSHIIAPAIHKTRGEVAKLMSDEGGFQVDPQDITAMTRHARMRLRQSFLSASIGISGANLIVAETGSVVLVTNEGNGRMVTSLPDIHIAVVGIEKVAPDWKIAAAWLSLLARSATGQPLSIYTNIISGPARSDDPDGPREVHIILLDNGRARLTGGKYAEVLECLRCGACLNVCPVYREAGGHAYGSPYSGPIGAVVSPLLFGLDEYPGLPQASTLCGACLDVCPVRIDLPRMLLELRADSVKQGLVPRHERWVERAAGRILQSDFLTTAAATLVRIAQRTFGIRDRLSLLGRVLPALSQGSFSKWWREVQKP